MVLKRIQRQFKGLPCSQRGDAEVRHCYVNNQFTEKIYLVDGIPCLFARKLAFRWGFFSWVPKKCLHVISNPKLVVQTIETGGRGESKQTARIILVFTVCFYFFPGACLLLASPHNIKFPWQTCCKQWLSSLLLAQFIWHSGPQNHCTLAYQVMWTQAVLPIYNLVHPAEPEIIS